MATEIASKLDFDALQKAMPNEPDPRQAMRRGGGRPGREARGGETAETKPAGETPPTATAAAKVDEPQPTTTGAGDPAPAGPASK
jgi:hypothetical protein